MRNETLPHLPIDIDTGDPTKDPCPPEPVYIVSKKYLCGNKWLIGMPAPSHQ